MEIINVTPANILLLHDFISKLGSASRSFRYFNSRTPDVINKHLVTLLAVEANIPVAYGHLENEKNITWLGVCVLPDFQNKGYAKQIMAALIDLAKKKKVTRISLTVDKDNNAAIKLYEIFNFKKQEDCDSYYKYSMNI